MNKKDWFYVVAIFVAIITLIIMMDYVRENSTIQLEDKYQLTNCTKGRGDNTVYCDEGKLSKFDYDRALNTIQGEQVDMAIDEALVDYYTREEVGAMLLERDNQIQELQEYLQSNQYEQLVIRINTLEQNQEPQAIEIQGDITVRFEDVVVMGSVVEGSKLLIIEQEPFKITLQLNAELLENVIYSQNSWQIQYIDVCGDICEKAYDINENNSPHYYYTYEEILSEMLDYLETLQELKKQH